MHPTLLLGLYSAAIVVASLLGGLVPLVVRLTHTRMQLAGSFVAGVMLGIGLLHMLPHSVLATHSLDWSVGWMLGGILALFFVQRFFDFHHHDVDDDVEPGAALPSVETFAHGHAHCDHQHAPDAAAAGRFAWLGASLGLAVHGLMDGVTLAAAVETELRTGHDGWAGVAIFLVILLHKPFDALTLGTVLALGRQQTRLKHVLNLVFALLVPVGVVAFYFGVAPALGASNAVIGSVLAFAAGSFLCIALSDLLPEMQFHRHDRVALSAALLLGVSAAWGIGLLEGDGHGHPHASTHDAASSSHQHHGDHDHDHHHDHDHP